MAKLEAVIAARQQEEEEARLKRERETETAIRLQQKEKVNMSSTPPPPVSLTSHHRLCTYMDASFCIVQFLGFPFLPGSNDLKRTFAKRCQEAI